MVWSGNGGQVSISYHSGSLFYHSLQVSVSYQFRYPTITSGQEYGRLGCSLQMAYHIAFKKVFNTLKSIHIRDIHIIQTGTTKR